MKVRLILAFNIFLGILFLDSVSTLRSGIQKLKDKSVQICDPELEESFNFFTKALSNSEKENLIKLNSSSEYARSTLPKGAGYDYTIQMAIYTLSESLYINSKLFKINIVTDSSSTKSNIFEVVDCLHSNSRSTLKLLKLIRQRCIYNTENSQLNIFPKHVAERLEFYCEGFKKIEARFARLSDFIYLLKMILKKSKIHNSNLIKLSKLIRKIIKKPSFKKIKFVKDLSNPTDTSIQGTKPNKKEAEIISKISTLLRHIDNTLLEKVRILPFWVLKASEEFSAILIETETIVDRVWSPMRKNISSNLKKLKKCTAVKKKSCTSVSLRSSKSKYKLSKNEKLIYNVQALAKQIRSDNE